MQLPKQLQLAQLVSEPPEGEHWVHEQKFDGYRILAVKDRRGVRLLSRRFRDWTCEFPEVAAAVERLAGDQLMIDGEVAVVLPDGRTSFQALQGRDGVPAYFAFDLLHDGEHDVTHLPLIERKQRLARLVAGANREVVVYSDHVTGSGREFFRLACQRGLEGIVSKRRDAPYTPGRGAAWQKTKCLLRQELVIGGYTEPEGSRAHFGALLVGYHDGPRLAYAGKVGTGFTHKSLVELMQRMAALERERCPFTPEPTRASTGASRHWLAPELVAEVAFAEWTSDGRLRHPSFQGLRDDKSARDVVRETPIVHKSRRM
jgi:bifunctional non-homologous end joining protein LigD